MRHTILSGDPHRRAVFDEDIARGVLAKIRKLYRAGETVRRDDLLSGTADGVCWAAMPQDIDVTLKRLKRNGKIEHVHSRDHLGRLRRQWGWRPVPPATNRRAMRLRARKST